VTVRLLFNQSPSSVTSTMTCKPTYPQGDGHDDQYRWLRAAPLSPRIPSPIGYSSETRRLSPRNSWNRTYHRPVGVTVLPTSENLLPGKPRYVYVEVFERHGGAFLQSVFGNFSTRAHAQVLLQYLRSRARRWNMRASAHDTPLGWRGMYPWDQALPGAAAPGKRITDQCNPGAGDRTPS